MKRLLCVLLVLGWMSLVYAQTPDSVAVKPKQKPLTQIQRDSLLMSIQKDIRVMSANYRWGIGRYKVYRTENIYTNLKLDTSTGRITALQIGVNDAKYRGEYQVCDAPSLYDISDIGRYELYPTGNIHNFILLDTFLGVAYQVQWSTKKDQCGCWMIL